MTPPSDDEDATRIRPATKHDSFALPIGTRLGEFELTHHIGEGGFGIVYLAYDHTLERSVALKEYMPSSLATRVGAKQINVRSERYRETFDAGMKSFINEAKLLARFDHPSLVKVFRFWQENGTAYMAMPFYNGVNMRDTVRALPEPPDEEWLLDLLHWLTEALAVIHAEHCYHRDIAPDNVMMLADTGRPLLLDFGAARRVIGDMTQALTVILKPGYAPVEQYAEAPGMKQGPWTDVYALAAVIYWTIAGKTPPPAVGRMLGDTCVPLVDLAEGRYSLPFLQAIDRALAVRPEQRTPDIHALRAELGLAAATVPAAASGVTQSGSGGVSGTPTLRSGGRTHSGMARPVTSNKPPTTGAPTAGAATAEPAPARTVPATRPPARPVTVAPSPSPSPSPSTVAPVGRDAEPGAAPAPNRRVAIGLGAGAVALLLGAGVGWWAFQQRPPVKPPVVVTKETAPSIPASTPAASAPIQALPAALHDVPRSAADAFAQWKAARDPAFAVSVHAPTKVTGPAAMQLTVASQQPGYLYLVASRSDRNELVLWHHDPKQRIAAGQTIELGAAALPAEALSPGSWHVMALVTRERRDLAAAGWQSRGAVTARGFDAAAPATSAPWWAAICTGATPACDQAYGADDLQIDVETERSSAAPKELASAAAPASRPTRAPRATDAAANERRPEVKANAAECARLLQQMSLGDVSAELSARFKTLGCR